MKCPEVQDQISAWLDAELDETTAAALEAHLDKCEACRREWRQLTALESALGQMTAPVPTGLAERVLAQIHSPRRRQWWQSAALAASLILGITLGGAMAHNLYAPSGLNGTGVETASLEVFEDFPQGSLGTIVASYQPDES